VSIDSTINRAHQHGATLPQLKGQQSGLLPSMGSVGDCYDNAVIESYCSRMQIELLDRQRWRTRPELAKAMFHYLEIFHNRRRRHSALGWLTPIEIKNRTSITVA
jgi:putative transposase